MPRLSRTTVNQINPITFLADATGIVGISGGSGQITCAGDRALISHGRNVQSVRGPGFDLIFAPRCRDKAKSPTLHCGGRRYAAWWVFSRFGIRYGHRGARIELAPEPPHEVVRHVDVGGLGTLAQVTGFDGGAILLPGGFEFRHGGCGDSKFCIQRHRFHLLLEEHILRAFGAAQNSEATICPFKKELLRIPFRKNSTRRTEKPSWPNGCFRQTSLLSYVWDLHGIRKR